MDFRLQVLLDLSFQCLYNIGKYLCQILAIEQFLVESVQCHVTLRAFAARVESRVSCGFGGKHLSLSSTHGHTSGSTKLPNSIWCMWSNICEKCGAKTKFRLQVEHTACLEPIPRHTTSFPGLIVQHLASGCSNPRYSLARKARSKGNSRKMLRSRDTCPSPGRS